MNGIIFLILKEEKNTLSSLVKSNRAGIRMKDIRDVEIGHMHMQRHWTISDHITFDYVKCQLQASYAKPRFARLPIIITINAPE